METITFGNFNSFSDFNLVLSEKNIEYPEPKTEGVDVVGKDGVIDLTETLGSVKYKNRKLEFRFTSLDGRKEWNTLMMKISNNIHGHKMNIRMDSDPMFYYIGRCTINKFQTSKKLATIVITCDCEPYKRRIDDPNIKSL